MTYRLDFLTVTSLASSQFAYHAENGDFACLMMRRMDSNQPCRSFAGQLSARLSEMDSGSSYEGNDGALDSFK